MTRHDLSLSPTRLTRGIVHAAVVLGLAFALVSISFGVVLGSASVAHAGTEDAQDAEKARWQGRYRQLLSLQIQLRDNAVRSRAYYAQAQRRNYPRGGARQQFIVDAEDAEKQLLEVKAETEALRDEARRAAIPQIWFYQVDDEPTQSAPAATATDDADANEDREGRNPLYFKD